MNLTQLANPPSWDRRRTRRPIPPPHIFSAILSNGIEWTHEFTQVLFSPDGQTLATVSKDEDVIDLWMMELWGMADCKQLYQLEMAGVIRVAFSKDGDTLATSSHDHTVRLWRASDGALLKILYGHMDTVTDLAFSPYGDLLASASYDETVILWGLK